MSILLKIFQKQFVNCIFLKIIQINTIIIELIFEIEHLLACLLMNVK